MAEQAAAPHLDTADVVLCLETLEHVPEFWNILKNMRDRLTVGAWIVLSAPGIGFPEHKHPVDCWRVTPDGMHAALRYTGARCVEIQSLTDPAGHESVFGYGQKYK
jgi:2-polyprenyl-3-methyl-5-hydroxy-6-metoxy-1,4-benzoquinol methylase